MHLPPFGEIYLSPSAHIPMPAFLASASAFQYGSRLSPSACLGMKHGRRLGGPWHRFAEEQIAGFNQSQGFVVHVEYQDVDVFVNKGSETVAVEVESLSGTKDFVSAVSNVMKAIRIADRVEVIVKDNTSTNKLQQHIWKSPLRTYRSLSIRLLEEHISK